MFYRGMLALNIHCDDLISLAGGFGELLQAVSQQ